MKFHFTARSDLGDREPVEALLYFNSQQSRAHEGIQYSIKRFGVPKIVEMNSGLTIGLDSHETQTIFAYDLQDENKGPMGVVVFLRDSSSSLGIVHIAVHPDFAHGGVHAPCGLTFQLIDEVKKVGRRIKGIEQVLFFYL